MTNTRSLSARILEVLAPVLRIAIASAFVASAAAQTSVQDANPSSEAAPSGGPVQLRQPAQAMPDERPSSTPPAAPPAPGVPTAPGSALSPTSPTAQPGSPLRYVPGEFERFVQKQAGLGVEIRRFGAELLTGAADSRDVELSPLVPADYIVAPGDEVLLTLWGSVDADLRLVVDRSGRISIPRVGSVQVSGVRNADLADVVSRRVATVFRNFQISVSLGQLRGIRVFVTGFALKPGTYTVSSLSTVVAALMRAGGPAASGSFRSIELHRGGQLVSSFDLYDLLLKGDRSTDRIVQAGDVIHVGPVGIQVGFIGSVNKPTVMELKPGETVADALRIAGGFTAVADRKRLVVERLEERASARVAQLDLPADLGQTLSHGDVLRALSVVDLAQPQQRQSKRVRVEGEVVHPAEYVLPQNSTIADALLAAGGLTPAAFVYATEFNRESVRITQQENYERALRSVEADFARTSSSQRVSTPEEAAAEASRDAATARLIDRLRALRPSGRVVLQLEPDSRDLPNLALEDGDRLYVPSRSTTIGVFGSVFNSATYLYLPGRTLDDYLRLAGGPTKGADASSVFVVRANGNVVSARQDSSWFNREGTVGALAAEPGDTIFVPEEMNKTTFLQSAKDWTQVLYQFGLGVAAFRVLTQ